MSAGGRVVKGRRILRAVLAAILLAVFVLPAAVLTAILHHHVDYRGNMPLKEVYSAAETRHFSNKCVFLALFMIISTASRD